MVHYSKNDFDFSFKRVRLNGKSLTKFDLGQILNDLRPNCCWFISYDVFTYNELVSYLKSYIY